MQDGSSGNYENVRLGVSHSSSLLPGGEARSLSSALSVPSLPKLRGQHRQGLSHTSGSGQEHPVQALDEDLQWSARRMQTAAAWAHSIRQTVAPARGRSDQHKQTPVKRQSRQNKQPLDQPSLGTPPGGPPLLDAHFLPGWLKARPEYRAVRAGGRRTSDKDKQGGASKDAAAGSGELLFVKQALHTPSQMRGPKEMALLQRWLRQQRRFAYLRPAQLTTVARSMTLQQSPPGTPVHSGGSAVYFVLEGAVTIRQWASKEAKAKRAPPRSTVVVPPGVGFGKHSGWQRLTSRLAAAAAAAGKGPGATASSGAGAIRSLLLKAKGAAARLRVARLAATEADAADSGSDEGSSEGEPDPHEVPPVVDAPLPLLLAGKRGRTKKVQIEHAAADGAINARSHIAHAVLERQRLMGSLREMVFFDPETCEAVAGEGDAAAARTEQDTSAGRGGVTAADEGGGGGSTARPSAARGDTTQVARLGDMEFATAWALQREGSVKALLGWLAGNGLSLLADCSSTRLKSLAGVLEERTYPPGAVLFRQGDVARSLLIVKSGHADCTLQTVTHHVQSWPTGTDQWEQVRSTQRHQRILGKVGPCVILGHECVLNMPQYSPAPRVGEAPHFDAVARQQGGAGGARRPSATSASAQSSPLSPGGGFVSAVFQSMAVGAAAAEAASPEGGSSGPATPPSHTPASPTSPASQASPLGSPASHFTPGPASPGAETAERGTQSAARLARVAQLLAPPSARPKGIHKSTHLPARRAFSLIARDHATVLVLPVHRVFDVLQSSAALARLGVAAEALVWAQWLAKRRDELYEAEDTAGVTRKASGGGHSQAGRSELLSTGAVSKLRARLQGVRQRGTSGKEASSHEEGARVLHSALFPEPDEADLRSGELLLPLAIQPHTYLGAVTRPATAAGSAASVQGERDRARSRQSSRESTYRRQADMSASAGALLQGTPFVDASPAWPGRPGPSDAGGLRDTGAGIFKSVPSASTAAARRREEAQRRRILAACVGDRYGKAAKLRGGGSGQGTELPEWSRDVRKLVQQSAAGLVPSLMAPPSVVALATLLSGKGDEGGSDTLIEGGSEEGGTAHRRKPASVVTTAAAALRGAAAFLAAKDAAGTDDGAPHTPQKGGSSHHVGLQGYAVSHTPSKYKGHLAATPGQLEAQAQAAAFERSTAERRAERKRKRQARKWQRTHERGKLLGALAHAKNVPAEQLLARIAPPGEGSSPAPKAAVQHADVFDAQVQAVRQQHTEAAYALGDRLVGAGPGGDGGGSRRSTQHSASQGRHESLRAHAAEQAAALRRDLRDEKLGNTLHMLRQLAPQHAPTGRGADSTVAGWSVSQLTQLAAAQRREVTREAPFSEGQGGGSPATRPAGGAAKTPQARRRIMAALSRV